MTDCRWLRSCRYIAGSEWRMGTVHTLGRVRFVVRQSDLPWLKISVFVVKKSGLIILR